MADIIIPRHVPLKVPKSQIAPAIGDFLMECGNCGNRQLNCHVRPREAKSEFRGTARVTEIICPDCGRVYKLDPHGNLGGGRYKKRSNYGHHDEIEETAL
jgi:hypothetical protein